MDVYLPWIFINDSSLTFLFTDVLTRLRSHTSCVCVIEEIPSGVLVSPGKEEFGSFDSLSIVTRSL